MPDRHGFNLLGERVRCIDCDAGGPLWRWPERKRRRHASRHHTRARRRADGDELRGLVRRWAELTDAVRRRVEVLVGTAAGDEALFEQRRQKARLQEGIAMLKEEERRSAPPIDPRSGSILAALFADRDWFDDFKHKLREGVVDEYGKVHEGYAANRIFEPQDASTLFLVLAQLAEEATPEIALTEHGGFRAAPDLPAVPVEAVVHLRRNGLLTCQQAAGGYVVGYGARLRELASRWGIALPAADEATAGVS
jgi:hypothetical protein